jgi:serine protease Do
MASQLRTSIGFLLTGILGVLVGALIVACASGKILGSSAAQNQNVASAAALHQNLNPDIEQRIIEAVKQSEPSVVLIKSTVHGVQQFYNPFGQDPFFKQFFGPQGAQPFTATASGSGFIYQRDGDTAYIATNAHVVYKADNIQVLLSNGRKFAGTVVGKDMQDDVALVKITGSDLPPALPVGDSRILQQGEFVLAIGEPVELQNSVSFGIVANVDRQGITAGGEADIPTIHYNDLIQITTPINPGNSGGPLITDTGEVVGINAVVDSGAQNIGFAVPMHNAGPILADIQSGKYIAATHPFIGVQMAPLDTRWRNYLGYSGKTGVLVAAVVQGSPADQAGLQQGDVIEQINRQSVASPDDVTKLIKTMKVGEKATLVVWRQGNVQPVDVTLGDENNFSLPQG